MQLNINLMPWREQIEKRDKKRIFISFALMLLLSVIAVFLVSQIYHWQITHQKARNAYLKDRLIYYSAMAKSAEATEKQEQLLLEKINLINNLQKKRIAIVYFFDLLPRLLPEGMYLTEVNKKGALLSLYGMTESNTQVAELMRKLTLSGWMKNPVLYEIASDEDKIDQNETYRTFSMTVDLVLSKKESSIFEDK